MGTYIKTVVSAFLLTTTLSAVEVSKFSGDARFYYGTSDDHHYQLEGLFDQNSSTGQFAVAADLGLTLTESVSANIGVSYLSTLGLDEVAFQHVFAGGTTKDQLWLDEINLDAKLLEETKMKLGRQYIASPMLYSIDWNIVSNAMDGVYMVDEHIPKTKLMGFWVGREWSNDYNATTDELNFAGNFRTFGEKGAFGVGAETVVIPTVTAELWYYDVTNVSTALWAQAESAFSGISLGAQFASRTPEQGDSTSGYALQAKYSAESYNISAAFSQMGDKGSLSLVNLAGVYGGGSKSPLYTEAWWNWGYVGSSDTLAYAIKAEAMLSVFYLGAYLTATSNDTTNTDTTDFTVSANTSLGALNLMAVYIYIQRDDYNNADGYNTLQGYLTYSF